MIRVFPTAIMESGAFGDEVDSSSHQDWRKVQGKGGETSSTSGSSNLSSGVGADASAVGAHASSEDPKPTGVEGQITQWVESELIPALNTQVRTALVMVDHIHDVRQSLGIK